MSYKDPDRQRAYQRQWLQSRRQRWLKANGPCARCGSWKDLQLDHKNSATRVSHRIWNWSKVRFDAEVAKCQVLCRLCHKTKTLEDYHRRITHCPHGHPYSLKNTRIRDGTNKRRCRMCDMLYQRMRRAQKYQRGDYVEL